MNPNDPEMLLSQVADSLLNKKYKEAKVMIESAEVSFNGQLTKSCKY